MHLEILLALIVSIDTYLAAAAYSNSEIRIPPLSAVVISIVSAAVMGISLKFSEILGRFIGVQIFETVGLIILIVIGMTTIFKSFIRLLVKRITHGGGNPLKMYGFGICISIYLDETAADLDRSKVLSPREAAVLALASSMDAAAMGLNFGYSEVNALAAAIFTMFVGFAAVLLGGFMGKKISSLRHDFSWVGGGFLIIFAVATYII